MTVINSAEFVRSSTSFEQCPTDNLPEYAFIGRSNVGKSSLINKLCCQPKLAKTSSTPGKTQLINHFLINQQWFLVDLPGYGFAKMPVKLKKKMEIMINEYLVNRPNLMNIYVLVDSRHEPLEIDLDFMARLALNQLPFSIVFTKADKNKKTRMMENIDKYKEVLLKSWEELPPIFLTSSETGLGTSDILEDIARINLLY